MSCFFCNSLYHVSQNCNIYISDESRQEIANSKNCCPLCLTYMDLSWCKNCEKKKKCYICFSKFHHTVYCPDRFEVSYMFQPNINNKLFSRFIKFLKFDEKYFLIFSYPNFLNSLNPNPFNVISKEKLTLPYTKELLDSDLIIAEKVIIRDECPLKAATFRIQNLEISDSTFSSKTALQLLSSKTKMLKCGDSKFFPKLMLREILENAPNLVYLFIFRTNVEITNSWPEDVLQMENDNLQNLYIKIPDFNFNVEKLAAYMKKKSTKFFIFRFFIDVTEEKQFNKQNALEMVNNRVSDCFTPVTYESGKYFRITFVYRKSFWFGKQIDTNCFEEYVLKQQ